MLGLLIGELISVRRWEKRVIMLGDGRDLLRRRLLRLRGLGWFAVILAAAQHTLYRSSRPDWLVDLFTGACLVLGVVLVGLGVGLAKRVGR